MMRLPYLLGKIKEKVFGDDDELDIKEFKERTAKLRIGGKDWLPLMKDFEGIGVLRFKGQRIKLEK
ncbi:MAG: hypothetical protein Sv326_1355 (plasmid) [Candidatus Fermentimicrarchaeum limneticum]|uniref:Uncharacterized protein n=1 Tax=Fermentimicrarchaeum limneticum TaxID=2795018 RepID=A0A7D5XKJ1_FERL1|nr:MAG: hypothetical protein Sv326_1355 [Candidatus Fermentimicrarchaeum limneticum]